MFWVNSNLTKLAKSKKKNMEDKYKLRWIYLIRYNPNLLGLGKIHLILLINTSL